MERGVGRDRQTSAARIWLRYFLEPLYRGSGQSDLRIARLVPAARSQRILGPVTRHGIRGDAGIFWQFSHQLLAGRQTVSGQRSTRRQVADVRPAVYRGVQFGGKQPATAADVSLDSVRNDLCVAFNDE